MVNLVISILITHPSWSVEHEMPTDNRRSRVIQVNDSDWQKTLDAAPPHSELVFNRNKIVTLAETFVINKPIKLTGLRARLKDGVKDKPLIRIISEDVSVFDFEIYGNRGTVPRKGRHVMLEVRKGGFHIEEGLLVNGSKDGMMVAPLKGENIVGGIIKNIIGRDNVVDVISNDGMSEGQWISNLYIENIRAYNCVEKGAVELSDGCRNCTVRSVYAANCLYAVDVQQHSHANKVNNNIVVEDIYAVDCEHGVRTALNPNEHTNITFRNLTAERCVRPFRIKNIHNLVMENIRVIDQCGDRHVIYIRECDNVTLRDITIQNATFKGPALILENCDRTTVDNLVLRGKTEILTSGLFYQITWDQAFTGLRIFNCLMPQSLQNGIVMQADNNARLSDYIITNNVARIVDKIQGERSVITNNIP